MRSRLVGLLCAAVGACGVADGGETPGNATTQERATSDAVVVEDVRGQAGPRVPIRVAGIPIEVEIADDNAERTRGLKYRESLGEDHGMLFVYEREQVLRFWMKDTVIPLDIAYADREGRIVDIRQMEPMSEVNVPSSAPAMYALEMNQGWFEAHGVRVGDRIEF